MNNNNIIGIAVEELYRIFEILNAEFFNNSLDYPIITIQKARKGHFGWFTLDKVWTNKEDTDAKYEINIGAEHLQDSTESIVDTLLHEMVHYQNKVNAIRDCNGQVHNKKFKILAESVGLIVDHSDKYGWGHTTCSEPLQHKILTIIKPKAESFEYFRTVKLKEIKPISVKTVGYTCPVCGDKIRGIPNRNIECVDCKSYYKENKKDE